MFILNVLVSLLTSARFFYHVYKPLVPLGTAPCTSLLSSSSLNSLRQGHLCIFTDGTGVGEDLVGNLNVVVLPHEHAKLHAGHHGGHLGSHIGHIVIKNILPAPLGLSDDVASLVEPNAGQWLQIRHVLQKPVVGEGPEHGVLMLDVVEVVSVMDGAWLVIFQCQIGVVVVAVILQKRK